jgi:hypothetical protein
MAKATSRIHRVIDEYGFDTLTVRTLEGGSKTIAYTGGIADIGQTSSMNPGGLGGSDYIRKADDVNRHIEGILRTVWLNDKEKGACIDFLNEIQQRANDFVEVRERFDVKFTYKGSEPGKNTFYFTEKADQAATMHTKISIVLDQPSGWTESDAWRALYAMLKPTSKNMKEIYEAQAKRGENA